MVEHLPTSAAPFGTISGLTTKRPGDFFVGDWIVAVDTDNDGVSDQFRHIHHDLQAGLPTTLGHERQVLAVNDAGSVQWTPSIQIVGNDTFPDSYLSNWASRGQIGGSAVIQGTTEAVPSVSGITWTYGPGTGTGNLAVGDHLPQGTVLRRDSAAVITVFAAPAILHGTGAAPPANYPDGTIYIKHAP
jgi:hypothetical protein